jgi:hypothetical protein
MTAPVPRSAKNADVCSALFRSHAHSAEQKWAKKPIFVTGCYRRGRSTVKQTSRFGDALTEAFYNDSVIAATQTHL